MPADAPVLAADQLQILQHALGLDQYGQGPVSRNHFCAGESDEPVCRSLVELGYMETFERAYLPYYNCTVTRAGVEAVQRESPPPPKLTRSQRRYLEFLHADSGQSFGEWLKDRVEYSHAR
jgi:hypothetical protein